MWLANLIGANENGEGIGNMGLVSLTTLDRKKNVSLNFMAMAGWMFYSLFNIKSVNFTILGGAVWEGRQDLWENCIFMGFSCPLGS